MTKDTKKAFFIKPTKKRNELRLPQGYYIVTDDWLGKIGYKAYCHWLIFHTWVDRSDATKECDSIPMSLEAVATKLGVTKKTLYTTTIIPLWEYGLIDTIEYEGSNRKANKPRNIVVFEYPQNNKELETKPLEKVRDWKKDHNTPAAIFSRKKHLKEKAKKEVKKPKLPAKFNRKKIYTVDRVKNYTVDGVKNYTVTVKKITPNNYSNNSINVSNNFNIIDDEYITNIDNNSLYSGEEFEKENEQMDHLQLYDFLVSKKIDTLPAKAISEMVKLNDIYLYDYEVMSQLMQMAYKMEYKDEPITNYPIYFLNGIIMQRQQRKTKKQLEEETKRYEEQLRAAAKKRKPEKPFVFYNWLEN